MVSVGAVLFAGGKSRRMGTDKASLTLHGDTFLQRIAGELSPFPEKLLSVDDPDRYPQLPWLHVTDEKPGCGPLGGLCAVLRACRSEALLVVSCDLPLYERRLGDYLCGRLQEPFDAVVSTTPDGTHPLCAVYRKRCLPLCPAGSPGALCGCGRHGSHAAKYQHPAGIPRFAGPFPSLNRLLSRR